MNGEDDMRRVADGDGLGRLGPDVLRRLLEATVAVTFGLAPGELVAPTRRTAPIAFARQVAIYSAHTVAGLSLNRAGRLFGRDRTTAAHACRVVEDRRDDPEVERRVAAVEAALRGWAHTSRGPCGEAAR
ncbi:helix-turn-helix domain-containing protein [Segnochrobactrum spirostomi]|uniref:Chromosomal replication initiator DnaA C-terminal domain-containing protein n=1 Tax=Segnochrobactrum spirostomi TaxID=2608987 RepID=A0A6A7Y3J5_9HYPH|nr:helix-turn-helix domain-containing protein [Segnochrobactrum spirostomi]MQT12339.1 hypothetical protein [Segnochrobactrum spirostomi]